MEVQSGKGAQYDERVIESEKALKKYPTCFDIVYQSAVIYSEKGYEQKDQKASFRVLELFDMACNLIEQNTDENISELSIRRQMARLHLSLGHVDTCVYDCVLLVFCAETYCVMGDLESTHVQ